VRVCSEPGCPNLQPESRCPSHRRAYERGRGTRQQRGYDAKHEAERKRWEPIVANGAVKCWRCLVPLDPELPWDLGHDDQDRSKYRGPEHVRCNRATAGRQRTEVTIVCGPPCSGKTTWVRQQAKPGDLIVDYDDIAQRLGSPRSHDHHPRYHKRVEATIARAIEGVRQGRHERAWIIRSGLERARQLASELDASLVTLNEPDDVLIARANTRPNPAAAVRAIRAWQAVNPPPA
jgi:hypothetical protein